MRGTWWFCLLNLLWRAYATAFHDTTPWTHGKGWFGTCSNGVNCFDVARTGECREFRVHQKPHHTKRSWIYKAARSVNIFKFKPNLVYFMRYLCTAGLRSCVRKFTLCSFNCSSLFIGEISGFIRWHRTANAHNDVSAWPEQVFISLHFTSFYLHVYFHVPVSRPKKTSNLTKMALFQTMIHKMPTKPWGHNSTKPWDSHTWRCMP